MQRQSGVIIIALCLIGNAAFAQPSARQAPGASKLKPDLADEHYGPHDRQVFDLWKAKSEKPTPLVCSFMAEDSAAETSLGFRRPSFRC